MQQLEAVAIEGLQHHLPRFVEPAAGFEAFFQVLLDTGKLRRFLGLDVQAGMTLGVAFGDIDHLVQGEDALLLEGVSGSLGIGLVEPAAGIQRLEFGQGEGTDRAGLALGIALGDIAGTPQHIVVDHHQHTIAGALQVHFQVVGAQLAGQQVGRRGGFRGIKGSAAVSNHRRVGMPWARASA